MSGITCDILDDQAPKADFYLMVVLYVREQVIF